MDQKTQEMLSAMGELLPEDKGLFDGLGAMFEQMEIAEDEIVKARGGNEEPGDDPVWKSFTILRPYAEMVDFVYRAHCRELIERVKSGADTTPATDAEMAVMFSNVTLEHPVKPAAAGLYMRIFKRAFPDKFPQVMTERDLEAYELVHGDEMDELERFTRDRLAQSGRVLEASEPAQ